MDKLTTEQKAERYVQALDRAKKWYNAPNIDKIPTYGNRIIEEIFPELKESEDEMIRKGIIHNLKYLANKAQGFVKDELEERIAWLEKQCEQKPTDKVEPKFKAGNWYQCTKDFFGKGVTFDKNTAYYCAQEGCLQNEYGCHIAIVKDLYDNFKLWAIQDAKDGDVLCCESGWTCIFKTLINYETFSSYCFMDETKWFCETGSECHTLKEEFIKAYNGKIYPATKEQRERFFAAMHDAGYEFDFEKKELKKISQRIISAEAKEAMYGKPTAWSENDEYIIERLSYLLDNEQENYPQLSCDFQEIQEFKDWLKSLKQRIKL